MTLVEYLAQLNSAETQWGLWVNPGNVDDYRVGQFIFDNGGVEDGFVCVGSLDSLSFGFQSIGDAFDSYFWHNDLAEVRNLSMSTTPEKVTLLGKETHAIGEALYEAWSVDNLAPKLQAEITKEVDSICQEWAQNSADFFVDERIPEIIAESEYVKAELELIYGQADDK